MLVPSFSPTPSCIARETSSPKASSLYEALRADPGLRSILQSQAYANNVMFAAIADVDDIAVAHADTSLEGQPISYGPDLAALLSRPALLQLVAIYTGPGRNPDNYPAAAAG